MGQLAAEPTDVDGPLPSQLALGLLGDFTVRRGATVLTLPSSTCRLVVLLGLERRIWSRSRVCGVLWADQDEARATANLRTVLWRLRQLAPELVEANAAGLRLAPAVTTDVETVTELSRSIEAGAVDLSGVDPRSFSQELLPNWPDEFIDLYRESHRQLSLHALESLAMRLLRDGQPARALQAALAAVVQAPLRESAHRVVIEAHLAEGNAAEAWRQLDLLTRALWNELGLVPSPGLRALFP